ncbi:2,3-bisphosphoglycerate-dependent phosphoglycerate mutase [Ruminiclostridium sufflavum DSM 19573]|uniref:2,3-bisphosphoglycerate-dependent phosphoglycerate mutase n=1 Tax=Ruminiclostridium sufflavum DSM 19573 TaxID=1121337 RepID=A0A318XJ74_9FIRM|nr:histidine phosphatase family protein [Ruminiclostridium sufflavum]PYG84899.1 2,3-bisphosphoglycerate-dependent phosphoglycerate mutase [Ruminiclostridium sufflavum DSM 19573]
MTNIYFVRHAQSDYTVHDDMKRPLTKKGMCDRALVSEFLESKGVSVVISSPYKRAYDTVAEFAQLNNLAIICMDKFKERQIADIWINDFDAYSRAQWSDFSYKLSSGESLGDVQSRNIEALCEVLETYPNETIVVGTHGTALSTIVNYFDKTFTYENFAAIVGLMPWIVHFQFDGNTCVHIDSINPFDL